MAAVAGLVPEVRTWCNAVSLHPVVPRLASFKIALRRHRSAAGWGTWTRLGAARAGCPGRSYWT